MSGEETFVYNNCQGSGCHECCPLKTYVKDGKITRTERVILPGPEAEHFMICQRGALAGRTPYMEGRILNPLKRVGERGEGKFEEISWDQAFEEIGDKINEIAAKYGPRSVIVNNFNCGIPNNYYGSVTCALTTRFVHTFDATMLQWMGVDMAGVQPVTTEYGDGLFMRMTNWAIWRDHRPKSIIIWGGAPLAWSRDSGLTRFLKEAQQEGTKLTDIGVLYDACAAACDEFVAVRTGTDVPLALAMCNVVIQEGAVDVEYMTNKTVAPFLVREDNGKFLREDDIEHNGSDWYVYIDANTGKPEYIPGGFYDFGDHTPDLEGKMNLDIIPCKTAYLKMKEHIAQWTPETQAEVTGVSAEKCLELAHNYIADTPAAAILMNFGPRVKGAGMIGRAINLLAILTGNQAHKEGRFNVGAQISGYGPALNDFAISCPDGMQNVKGVVTSMDDILESFENPDYEGQQYKALINPYSNPVQNWPNRELWEKRFMPNMELVVCGEIRMTDTVRFADYVLPSCTIFEREEISTGMGDCMFLNEPAIDIVGNTKNPSDIWRGFTSKLPNAEYFDHDNEYYLRLRLEAGDPEFTSIEPKVTLERLREEKIIRFNVPEDNPYEGIWETQQVPTDSGRIEFYSEHMADVGSALATYIEPQYLEDKQKAKKYPLQYYAGRHRFYMQSQLTEIPELRAISGMETTVGLNPATARERGIAEGDYCEVFNEKGSVLVKAHLSQMFPPNIAHVWYAYDSKYYPSDPPTALSSPLSTKETADPFTIRFGELLFRAYEGKISKTLVMPVTGGYEIFWDDLVDVRKCEKGA